MIGLIVTTALVAGCGQVVTPPFEQPASDVPMIDSAWATAAIGYVPDHEVVARQDIEESVDLSSSGADIWFDRDAFVFMYTEFVGDGSIVARLDRFDAVHEWSKAGLMIREDLTPEARNVLLHTSGEMGAVMQARRETGATTSTSGHDPSAGVGGWMRLSRVGDRIVGELSSDGETWRELGAYTLEFDTTVLVGLAVAPNAAGELATARFSHLSLARGEEVREPVVAPIGPVTDWVCGADALTPSFEPTYYVAPSGSDANDGRDPSRPLRTIQRAADVVNPGDVVWVREGTYSENVTLRTSGTSSRPIVFESYPGECAVIDGASRSAGAGLRLERVTHNVVRNFMVRNYPSQGIYLTGSSDNLIAHVRTYANGLSGIQSVGGDRNRFTHFISHDNYDPPTRGEHADGIGLSSGNGNVIDHCVVYRNSDDGIDTWRSVNSVVERCVSFENGFQASDGDGNGFKAGGAGVRTNTIVRYSVAFGNKVTGFTYNSSPNVTFEHNTAFDNRYGFIVGSGVLRNNVAFDNGTRELIDDGGNNQVTNSWNLGSPNPRFVSTEPMTAAFLALDESSPLADAGTPIGLPYSGAAPDLGAVPVGETIASFLRVPLAAIVD